VQPQSCHARQACIQMQPGLRALKGARVVLLASLVRLDQRRPSIAFLAHSAPRHARQCAALVLAASIHRARVAPHAQTVVPADCVLRGRAARSFVPLALTATRRSTS
jgi:hypothetical protein